MLQIKKFTFNPFAENTYVIYNEENQSFLVDPGNVEESETKALQNFISENQLNVKNILLTHAHIDHVLGLQWAYDTYKVPVLMHALDQELLDMNPMTASKYGFLFKPFVGEITFIEDEDVLQLGAEQLKVYYVPGHAPGHVAFHSEQQSFLVSGDVLFEGSIGRTDLYKGNLQQLLESIRTKVFILKDETVVYSGHGNSTTVGFEKKYNPFLN